MLSLVSPGQSSQRLLVRPGTPWKNRWFWPASLLQLVDAAGVRETSDPVEREGVRRAREKALAADLVLLVVDGSQATTVEDVMAFKLCEANKTILVVNKCDHEKIFDVSVLGFCGTVVELSAKYGTGLDALRSAVVKVIGSGSLSAAGEGVVVTERRHRDALLQAVRSLEGLLLSVENRAPLEFLALDAREALGALGQITGETTPDQILDEIFSRFCIGK